MNARRFVLIAFAIFGVVLLGACKRRKEERPPIAVRVEVVQPTSSALTSRYSGTVSARTQIDLAFRAAGYVDAIASVPTSTTAEAAMPLNGELSGRGASRAKKTSRRGTRPLQAGDHVSAGAVLASLRLSDFKQRVAELRGMRAEAVAAYWKARADLDRAKTLFAEGAISRAEFDAVKSRNDALGGGAGAAAAREGQAGLALSDAELKSPIDGVVLERKIEVGALVSPGAPAFVLADTSTVKVVFGVPDTVRPLLALGQEVVATTDAFPDRAFSGAITKLGAQADARTRVFEIEATFDNAEALLRVGMVTNIQVGRRESAADQMLLPLSAIVRVPPNQRGYWTYVVVDEPGGPTAHVKPVELAHLVGNRVAVTRGLAPGERVVVQGATLLTEGQRVNVVPGTR